MIGVPAPVVELLGPDLNGVLAARGFRTSTAVPQYVRFKPGAGAVVGVVFDDGVQRAHGYVRWCVSADRAIEIAAKAATMRLEETPLGPGVRRLNDGQTILVLFPNDLRLRRLRWASSVRKLKRLLTPTLPWGDDIRKSASSIDIVRYKPERRLIARVDLELRSSTLTERMFLRYSTTSNAPHLHLAATALRDAGVAAPEPLVSLEGGRLHMERMVPGTDLVDAVADGTFNNASLIADTINQIHRTTPPKGFTQAAPAFVSIGAALDSLLTYDESLDQAAAALRQRLGSLRPRQYKRFIHGDMHLHQFVVGEHANVVDLERSAVGHPMADVGRWYAHTISLEQRLHAPAAARVGHFGRTVVDLATKRADFDPEAFALHAAAGLVDQALRGARHLEPGWRSRAAELLDHAISITTQRATVENA